MKRLVITDSNALTVQALDEDVFSVSNAEIELVLDYDSLFDLALKLTKLLQEAGDEAIETQTASSDSVRFEPSKSLH
ncbi:MAG: hypothetical protein EOP05_22385 [Proteobacteria bacterium]|nr:MAG: hypothetical protein EOP05_22385 [Pseudomonadota bacterium]